ncbi:hypothetical protein ACLQ8T_05825 [Glutamicibacter sp. FR1]|uniref:hypothetical protein n=1 Tax=Glutamicibacter sp. FR1 TaxID=3393744 RepID=UPI0039B0F20C
MGKAAIFFGVLCALAVIATTASGSPVYGIIGALAGIMAITCGILWGIVRDAKKRRSTN